MKLLSQIQTGKRPMPPRIMTYGTEGVGKAQPLDAQVLTPRGFVAMGSLSVGDEVIGSDGKPHRVLGVYPQGQKEVYRVVFRDGSTTRCCDDHLWFTQTRCERDRQLAGAVRTLRDIRRTLRYGTHFNHGVPRVRPVEFAASDATLPIDPWLLGMYLGDGSSAGNIVITNPEPDVQEKVAASLDPSDTCSRNGGIGLRVRSRVRTRTAANLKQALQVLGLDGLEAVEKHVPQAYLHASVQQRLELLRGLLDSDGFVTNPGAVEFCTVSPQLARDVCFLIRSLGGSAKPVLKPKTTFTHRGVKRQGLPAWRVFASFPADLIPVSSRKHLAKWAEPRWAIRHTIRGVEPLGVMPCQCIRIDAPDSLYVTDDFILTHNSTFASQAPQPIFIQTEDGLDQINCTKFPLARTFEDVTAALGELAAEKHDFQTVVIDSLDWLERLIWDDVCRKYGVTTIEKADGGYGKGYIHALSWWRQVIDRLMTLRNDRGMAVLLIAHAKIEKFEDPEATAYDRYSPRLNKHAAALLCEWCDAVLFATLKIVTKTEDAGFNRKRTTATALGAPGSGGERILRAVGGPACVAKNRYGIKADLPLSWAEFMAALETHHTTSQGEQTHGNA